MAKSGLPKEELAAAVAAREELGEEREPELVAGFLDRIEREIDAIAVVNLLYYRR
jgi:hypothetical protein